jgi:transcription initiation factor IIE alpha subunit
LESEEGTNTVRALLNYASFQGKDAVTEILQCLKKHGQRLDLEIAKETGVPLSTVRQRLTGLAATGAVIMCNLTRFENGKRIEGWLCRVSGYIPPAAPGRKPKPIP